MALPDDPAESRRTPPWAVPAGAAAEAAEVDPATGLSPGEAARRLAVFGPNALVETPPASRLEILGRQFRSPMVYLLLAAVVLSVLLGDAFDAAAIGAILVLNAGIGYLQEAKAERAVADLKKLTAPRARVLRGGTVAEIPAAAVVPGDLLVVEAGDLAAADARIVAAAQLRADEAALTGESLPSDKGTDPVAADAPLGDRTCMLFGGTVVAAGSGRAVVTATGMRTEVGRIAGLLGGARPGPTPLQVRLAAVGNRLVILCLAVVGLVVLLGILRGSSPAEVVLTGISLAVAAVPEGLPTVVTLALALAVRRLVRRRAIVRRLPAVETLGSVDVICTDKTGTLTEGRPSLREIWLAEDGLLPADAPGLAGSDAFGRLIRAAVLGSNATVAADGTATGDPTEAALVRLARERGVDPERLRRVHPRRAEFAFDSVRKRMGAVTEGPDGIRLSVKGAPESVLPLCDPADGRAARAREAAESLAGRGRRVLAVAGRTLDALPPADAGADDAERGLTCLGLVAMSDPPRPESAEAVRACQEAGIRVVMITGDHPATARAIATELGILETEKRGQPSIPGIEKQGLPPFLGVLTGPELAKMTPEMLAERVEEVAVYARVTPEDKLNIVRAWKAKGRTVAMTGDGVNDAPALREAAVGVAMGRGGTETARQAAAMVLTDDRFDTIVAAVEEGRAVHGNIRRSIQYLLSGNLAEIAVMLGAAAAGWPAPLAAVHLLWINLVTDGLPALALAAEPVPAEGLRATRRPSPGGYGGSFYSGIAIVGLLSGLLTLGVYRWGLAAGDVETARTYAFSFLVFEELFRSFACRSDRRTFLELGGRSNLFHLAAIAAPLALQMLMHHAEGFDRLFRVRPVGWGECLALLALALVPVTVIELAKLGRR